MSISWWLRIIITRWCYHEGTILEAKQVLLSWMIQKSQAANPPANWTRKLCTSEMPFLNVQKGQRRKFCLNAAKLIGCQHSEIIPQVQDLAFSWRVKYLPIKKVRLPFLGERNISGLLPPKPPMAPISERQSFCISGSSGNKCLLAITHEGFYLHYYL